MLNRILIASALALAATFAFAEEANAQGRRGEGRAEARQELGNTSKRMERKARRESAKAAPKGVRGERSMPNGKRSGERRGERRERIIRRFDQDGDGQLNPQERRKLKKAIAKRRGQRGARRRGEKGQAPSSNRR